MKTRPDAPVIVVLSDLHVGSTKGLMPESFTTVEGVEVRQNAIQQYLWACWIRAQNFIQQTVGDDPFVLVLNGDLTEGIHHGTKEIWSAAIEDQMKAAFDVVEPLAAKASKVFLVRGTECHTHNLEAGLGAMLGAVQNPEMKIAAFDRLTLSAHGTICVFRHHISTSSRRSSSGSALSANLAEEQLEAAVNGERLPQVLVCSHRHKPGIYRDEKGMVLVTPAWQFLTRHGHKVVGAARCKPGVQILDWRGLGHGELPRIHERYYATPQPKIIAV